jgi:hypothetical protein
MMDEKADWQHNWNGVHMPLSTLDTDLAMA